MKNLSIGDTIFNAIWCALMIWTCRTPDGYAPYVLLGFNGGDLVVTLYCGLTDGYLREEGDFNFTRFITTTLAFALLGGFYAGELSFRPGSDAYNNAIYLVFASFWLSFGYRFLQYGLIHVLKK